MSVFTLSSEREDIEPSFVKVSPLGESTLNSVDIPAPVTTIETSKSKFVPPPPIVTGKQTLQH